MENTEKLTLVFSNQAVPRSTAEKAGELAYRFFASHTQPELNPLTFLSHAVRRYDDRQLLTAPMRRTLTDNGFLNHGEDVPIKRRLRLPGVVAVSLVVPELEFGLVVGEYLEEPFREATYLDEWYQATKPPVSKPGTPLSWRRDTAS